MMHLVITADFPVSDDPCYWNSALHFILFSVLRKNSTFSRIENNDERRCWTPGQIQRRQKIAMGSCQLKITMKHFEATLQKIKRRTIAINNPSLV